jgi:hypothetical protein
VPLSFGVRADSAHLKRKETTMGVARVTLPYANTGGNGQSRLTVSILTGGKGAPLVTLADNNGFPEVVALYAKADSSDDPVIILTFVFSSPIDGTKAKELAVNCFQEDATQYTFPYIGLHGHRGS